MRKYKVYIVVSVLISNKAKIKLSCTEDISDRFTDSMAEDNWKKLKFMTRKINSSNVTEP